MECNIVECNIVECNIVECNIVEWNNVFFALNRMEWTQGDAMLCGVMGWDVWWG